MQQIRILQKLGSIQDWASVYPVFHWSLIPWGFYLVLAVAFGFMLHVRKRDRQKYSEACARSLENIQTGSWEDSLTCWPYLLDRRNATTFSLATPLMASVINVLFGVELNRVAVTIVILVITCIVYTYSLLHGFKGISILAKACIYLFFGLLAFVLLFGGEARYIIETGFSALGRMAQNFLNWPPIQIRGGPLPSHRTGPYFTGLTGWSGAWQLRSLSAVFPGDGQFVRQSLGDMCSELVPL